jgi:DNA-binding transcriptional ArsR family regulator
VSAPVVVDEADVHEQDDLNPANTRKRTHLRWNALIHLNSELPGRGLGCAEECARALKALAHPIRLSVLAALGHGELSPSQFARSRAEPVSNVSYHFRHLAERGWIELVRTRPVGGSVEHVYRRISISEAGLFDLLGWLVEPPPMTG